MSSHNLQYNGIVKGDANQNCNIYRDCVIHQGMTDKCIELAVQGDYQKVQDVINNSLKAIAGLHPLFPEYLFQLSCNNGKGALFSKPISEEAKKKFPPKIKCKGNIMVGDKGVSSIGLNFTEYANRHQLPIRLHILEAKKMLGDVIDPIQIEADKLVGKTAIVQPIPFPEAEACNLMIGNQVEYDYLLLRINEILDDDTIVISNSEQKNIPLKIWFSVNQVNNKTEFKVSLESSSNRDLLKYNKFMKKLMSGSVVTINLLAYQEILFQGSINEFSYQSCFENLDDEIRFLEDIVLIEDYFGRKIIIGEIYEKDLETIEYIKNFIQGIENELTWENVSFEMKLTEDNRNLLLKEDGVAKTISYIGGLSLQLFNNQYEVSVKREFEKAYIKDYEKIKDIANILSDGENLKIEFIPGVNGESGKAIDSLLEWHK